MKKKIAAIVAGSIAMVAIGGGHGEEVKENVPVKEKHYKIAEHELKEPFPLGEGGGEGGENGHGAKIGLPEESPNKEHVHGYSNEQLLEMAFEFYEAVNGHSPMHGACEDLEHEMVSIKLFNIEGDRFYICETYTVHRVSGVGTDSQGEKVELLHPDKIEHHLLEEFTDHDELFTGELFSED